MGAASQNNASAPIGSIGLNGGTFRVPVGSAEYYVEQLHHHRLGQRPLGHRFPSARRSFRLHLTGTAGGIIATGDTTWTGGGTSHPERSNHPHRHPDPVHHHQRHPARKRDERPGVPTERRRDDGPDRPRQFGRPDRGQFLSRGGRHGTRRKRKDHAPANNGRPLPRGPQIHRGHRDLLEVAAFGTNGGRIWVTNAGTNLTLSGSIDDGGGRARRTRCW